MKKRSLFRGLCMTIAATLLASVLPMGVMAADELSEDQPITADYATYVRDHKDYIYKSFNDEEIFYVTVKSGNNKYGLVGFDLSQVKKEGYVVDTAKLTLSVDGYKRIASKTETSAETGEEVKVDVRDTGAHSFSVYALGNIDYTTTPAQTYNTALSGKSKTYLSSTVIAPEGTIEKNDMYEFDVSSYFDGLEKYSDDFVFAIYADALTDEEKAMGIHTVEVSFTAEKLGSYSPSLMVTYKVDESEKNVDSKTISVNYDTCIRADKPDADESKATDLLYQENNNDNFDREVLLGFNIQDVAAPAGKQIDTAKITVYSSLYNNNGTKNASGISLYAMGFVDYNPETIISNGETIINWSNTYNSAKSKIATTTFCPENTFTNGEAYDFDVTEYFAGKPTISGSEMFAIRPDNNSVSGAVCSMQKENGKYAAKLTVTYKPLETITILTEDSRIVTDIANQNNSASNFYKLRNFGNSFKSVAKFMFEVSDIGSLIPEGKVISSVELKIFAQQKVVAKSGNLTVPNVTMQGLRVVNYEDNFWLNPDVTSSEASHEAWTGGYDENAVESALTSNNVSISGVAPLYAGMDASEYEGEFTVALNKWYSVDVTEFVVKQMNNKDSSFGYASFIVLPNMSENGPTEIANKWHANAPRLVINLADASEATELKIGKPVYTKWYDGTVLSELTKTATFVSIPVSGISKTPVSAKIYVAEYDATGALVKIAVMNDFDFYQGNGDLCYGFTPTKETAKVRSFVWQGNNVPVVEIGEANVSAE